MTKAKLQAIHLEDVSVGKIPFGVSRSSKWRTVRAQHLKKQPVCQVCGGKKFLEVHHLVPFHIDFQLELDPNNLMTLCESKKYGINCHLWMGHLGNFKTFNKTCTEDAQIWNAKFNEVHHAKT